MATNRKRTPRSRREGTLTAEQHDWLYGGHGLRNKWAILARSEEKVALWAAHKEDVLLDWISQQPCSRPQRWWDYDAPAEAIEGGRADGHRLPHRRRLGGVGTPQHEVLSIAPHFTLGLPVSWVEPFMVEYYNGRAVDTHGNPIVTKYRDGDFLGKTIDPRDPPLFESQAAYLQRHGLLTGEERKYLTKNPRLLENEVVEPFSAVEA